MTPPTPDPTKACGRCIHAKLRAADSVTCWNQRQPWYGATLSVFDTCDQFEARVIVVKNATETSA